MKKKKKIIIISIICLAILLILILGIILSNKKDSSDEGLDRKAITNIFEKGIELNKLLTSDKLDSKASYQNDLGDDCFAYLGDDVDEQIEKIKEVYYNFESNISLFNRSIIKGESGRETSVLYVCPSKKCKIVDKFNKNFNIKETSKELLTITYEEGSFMVSKKDDKYLLISELYSCEYEIPEGKDPSEVNEIIVRK